MKKYKYISIITTLAIMVVTALAMSAMIMNNDGSFILATGNYILEHGVVPKTHPFSIVDGLDFVAQQWLWTIICSSVYNKLGKLGIYILCIVIYLLNLLVVYKIAKIKEVNTKVMMTLTSLIYLLTFNFISIRPTMITNLLLLLQIYVIEKFRKTNNKWLLAFLIPIMILEINLHASLWWMHFVFLLPYIVPAIKNPIVRLKPFDKEAYKKDTLPIIVSIVPMILTGLANPYGINGVVYLINSYNKQLNTLGILELKAPSTTDFTSVIMLIIMFICIHLILNKNEINSAPFYMFCGTSILGLMHLRNVIYFYFGLVILLLELLKDADLSRIKKFVDNQGKLMSVLSCGLVMCGLIIFAPEIVNSMNKDYEDNLNNPVKAIEYLDKNADKEVKLFTEFNSGGYFELQGYKIFVDARPELYFENFNNKVDIMGDYKKLLGECKTDAEFKEILNKYDFDYLCVDVNTQFNLYLEVSNEYEKVVESEEYNLYKPIYK